MNDVTRHTPPL
jgi:hypothetical protein